MGRSVVFDKLRWLVHEKPKDVVIGYTHRLKETGSQVTREIKVEDVLMVNRWAMLLSDGETVIPLHRIVYIKKGEKIIYMKGRSSSGS